MGHWSLGGILAGAVAGGAGAANDYFVREEVERRKNELADREAERRRAEFKFEQDEADRRLPDRQRRAFELKNELEKGVRDENEKRAAGFAKDAVAANEKAGLKRGTVGWHSGLAEYYQSIGQHDMADVEFKRAQEIRKDNLMRDLEDARDRRAMAVAGMRAGGSGAGSAMQALDAALDAISAHAKVRMSGSDKMETDPTAAGVARQLYGEALANPKIDAIYNDPNMNPGKRYSREQIALKTVDDTMRGMVAEQTRRNVRGDEAATIADLNDARLNAARASDAAGTGLSPAERERADMGERIRRLREAGVPQVVPAPKPKGLLDSILDKFTGNDTQPQPAQMPTAQGYGAQGSQPNSSSGYPQF